MAINYTPDYNAKLRREVQNFNKKRNRAIKRGFTNVPPLQKVSDLKARYTNRNELDRELKRLQSFTQKDLTNKIENRGGAKAIAWDYQNLKTNAKAAKGYFEREYERVSKRTGRFPGERLYLDNIKAKMDLLDLNLAYMTQSQFNSAKAAINEFSKSIAQKNAEYRGFLSEVDWVMETLNIPNDQRDAFFKKFQGLTANQFLYAYDNNDIIGRVYQLYLKPKDGGEATLNTSEEDAEDLIGTLMEEADDIVEDAKKNAD